MNSNSQPSAPVLRAQGWFRWLLRGLFGQEQFSVRELSVAVLLWGIAFGIASGVLTGYLPRLKYAGAWILVALVSPLVHCLCKKVFNKRWGLAFCLMAFGWLAGTILGYVEGIRSDQIFRTKLIQGYYHASAGIMRYQLEHGCYPLGLEHISDRLLPSDERVVLEGVLTYTPPNGPKEDAKLFLFAEFSVCDPLLLGGILPKPSAVLENSTAKEPADPPARVRIKDGDKTSP